jgi:hypothetical protein
MIDPHHLERVRTVVAEETTGTNVSADVLQIDSETALHAATRPCRLGPANRTDARNRTVVAGDRFHGREATGSPVDDHPC